MAYQASAVLIETDDAPRPALPVQTRNIYVLPFAHPTVERVSAQAGENLPIVATSTLVIAGKELRGEITRIVIGGAEFTPTEVAPERILLPMPAGLRPGVHALQVMQRILMGSPPPGTPHRGFESNVATFVLRPRINAPVVVTTKRVFDVPLPRPRNVFEIHNEPGFTAIYHEIWQYFKNEIKI